MFDELCKNFNIHDKCRVCLSGGKDLTNEVAKFCSAIGEKIVKNPFVTIITGGFQYENNNSNKNSADFAYIQGVLKFLSDENSQKKQIVTMLPDKDNKSIKRFEVGRVYRVPSHNIQSRRFSMVKFSDIILTIGGADGTEQIIDLAFALNKLVFPIPFTGGASQKQWKEYRSTIINNFSLDDNIVAFLEKDNLQLGSSDKIYEAADKIVRIIEKPVDKKCFVIMPFSKTKSCTERQWTDIFDTMIKPAVEGSNLGFQCLRANFHSGKNILKGILTELKNSDVVIADLTDKNANVYYELGVRQALNDNTILISQSIKDTPFDLATYSILQYSNSTHDDRNKFEKDVRTILGAISTGENIASPIREYFSIVE